MNFLDQRQLHLTRRHFFGRTAAGIGTAALASLLNPKLLADPQKHMWNLYDKEKAKLLRMLNDEPMPLAVAVTEDEKPRMVVFGDTEFLTDFEMLASPSKTENYAFFLSSLEWMAEKESIGIQPKRDSSFRLPAAAMSVLGRMILLPGWLMLLTLITLGACIWVVRRR